MPSVNAEHVPPNRACRAALAGGAVRLLYDSRKFGDGQKWRPELLYFQAIKLVELVGIEL